jgi:hypothetical protein
MTLAPMTHADLLRALAIKGEPPCGGMLHYLGSCYEPRNRPGGGYRLVRVFVSICPSCGFVTFSRPYEDSNRYTRRRRDDCTYLKPRRPRNA